MAKILIVPFVLYLVGTSFVGRLDSDYYPIGYAAVVLFIAAAMCWLMRSAPADARQRVIAPHWRVLPGVAIGLLGIALWVVLSDLQLEQMIAPYLPGFLRPEARTGYNPFEELANPLSAWAFIAVRVLGLAVIVPIAEELFWRGFLMRWLVDPEWEKVPIGEYTFSSCMLVTLMFTLAHPEWLAAAVYCLLINGLLYWKRDLWQCIIAHAVSNLALAIYVLLFEAWWLW